jgi:hypothetical protein
METLRTVEEALLGRILYIGDKIPKDLTDDPRPKFILLGTPQEFIDETSEKIKIKPKKGGWTKEELDKHIEINSKHTYSMVVVLSTLYLKLYGVLPEIGLSGAQAEMAKKLVNELPVKLSKQSK